MFSIEELLGADIMLKQNVNVAGARPTHIARAVLAPRIVIVCCVVSTASSNYISHSTQNHFSIALPRRTQRTIEHS